MLENKKVIIFDLDGTLIDSIGVWSSIDIELIKTIGDGTIDNVDIGKQRDEKLKEPYKKPTNVEVGDRDNQLFSYINNIYYKTRLDYDEILCLANHFNETVLEKPFPEKVVRYKVKKVFEKDRGKMIFINLDE